MYEPTFEGKPQALRGLYSAERDTEDSPVNIGV